MKLHELSIKRPVAVVMIILMFLVIGLYSLTMLPMEMMPKMDMSMAIVLTTYSNVGSEEVESLVTKNVESAISSVSGIDSMTSQSSEGTSIIMVSFDTGTDMNQAVADMKDNLELYEAVLPEDANEPMVVQLDANMMPVVMMNATMEGYDLVQTKKYIDDNLKSKLEAVPGVASVNIYGANERQIEVIIDPEKVFGYGVSMTNVMQALAAQNQNMPAGTTEGFGKDMAIRSMGKFKTLEEIDRVPIMTPNGQIIYLRDVASVHDTYSESTTFARLNSQDALSISISKESDANTVEVVNGVNAVIENFERANSKFGHRMVMEQASYIENAVSSVAENAVTGAVLAIIILLLFLGSIRSSLVIGVTMPVSIITTFMGFFFTGMSLNVVSLGGLALGVGMLVDNAVVVLENIYRRRIEFDEDGVTAAQKGTGQVVGSVVASVITTCIVYVPVLFIDNMVAVMFKQLAFSIIFSQIASLLTTFLIIPMLSARIKDVKHSDKAVDFVYKPFQRGMDKLYILYDKSLRWSIKNRKKFILIPVILFIISMIVLGNIGMTLMPAGDEGTIAISIECPQGTQLESTNELVKEIEEIISKSEIVEYISTTVGSGGGMSASLGTTSGNTASITVTLKDDRKETTEEAVQGVRDSLKNITGATISVEASNTSMAMATDEIQFSFTGDNDSELEEYVKKAEGVLAGIDGVSETSTSLSETKSEVRIYVDSARASRYGLNTTTISSLINNAIQGKTATRFNDNGTEYDIIVKYPDNYAGDYTAVKNLQLQSPTGQWVTLGDVADVTVEQGYTTLQRVDQKRTVTLTGKLFDTDMGTVNKEFAKRITTIEKPDGVNQTTSGNFEVMMEAMGSLVLAIILGILLMYMVMAAQFENTKNPIIILMSVPLAMIGVVLALVIAGEPLSVIGCVGILMLIGIVVNNAIILIDFITETRGEKPEIDRADAIVYSGKTRMRPVLMTTLTSVLGFLPMALSNAEGSEMMRPLAVVLVGGLSVSTLLTLYVIPVLYTFFDDHEVKRKRKKRRKEARKEAKIKKALSEQPVRS